MGRDKLELTQICQRYKMRVIRIIPQEGYYLLETNRGPKELRPWPRLDILRWSHAWREHMARHGYRMVERFIRTRDAKPYVVWGKTGYTLTDHLRETQPLPVSADAVRKCGQVVSLMHAAQRAHHVPFAADVVQQDVARVAAEAERARRLYAEVSASDGLDAERSWLVRHFPPLLERMERAVELLRSVPLSADAAVSHGTLGRDNWRLVNDKLVLCGFYRPTLGVQQRDVAAFLRELLSEGGDGAADVQVTDAFLDGYEEHKPLRSEEYQLLLAFLANPYGLWKRVEQALTAPEPPAEETMRELVELVRAQQRLERLLVHIARRAERAAKG